MGFVNYLLFVFTVIYNFVKYKTIPSLNWWFLVLMT